MNIDKTKIVSRDTYFKIISNDQIIENITEITYVGQIISEHNETKLEIDHRIKIAGKNIGPCKIFLKVIFKINIKDLIFNDRILPTFTYEAQTWITTEKEKKQLKLQNVKIYSKFSTKKRIK